MTFSFFRAFRSANTRRPVSAGVGPPPATRPRNGLSTLAAFGGNPGALRMKVYVPPGLGSGRPLIVVLHGCGQSAEAFAQNAGWIALADRLKVALVMPEQTMSNNRGRCFNWFRHLDVQAKGGEAASIRQMIRTAVKLLGSDRKQIFVVGFSAGGGMAAALIGIYPALFAAGAVVAGMPVGCASTPVGALMRMRHADLLRSREHLATDLRQATGTRMRKKWPRLAIWQGEMDRTVDPGNAELLAAQWGELHGFGEGPATDMAHAGTRVRHWAHTDRLPAIELRTLPELGHAFPIKSGHGFRSKASPWTSDVGLSGSHQIAAFWGLKR